MDHLMRTLGAERDRLHAEAADVHAALATLIEKTHQQQSHSALATDESEQLERRTASLHDENNRMSQTIAQHASLAVDLPECIGAHVAMVLSCSDAQATLVRRRDSLLELQRERTAARVEWSRRLSGLERQLDNLENLSWEDPAGVLPQGWLRYLLESTRRADCLSASVDVSLGWHARFADEREGVWRDVVTEVQDRLDHSASADGQLLAVADAANAAAEATIVEGRATLDEFAASRKKEMSKLLTVHKRATDQGQELAHHMHRGTHAKKSTKLTTDEQVLRQRYAEVMGAIQLMIKEHTQLVAEIAELDRVAETMGAQKFAASEEFEVSRSERLQALHALAAFTRSLEEEVHLWREAKTALDDVARRARQFYAAQSSPSSSLFVASTSSASLRLQNHSALISSTNPYQRTSRSPSLVW